MLGLIEEITIRKLKLNYGFRYENRKFVPSRSIIDDGKLTLEKYTGELLIYQRAQNDVETSKTTWELFEETFSALIEPQNIHDEKSKFSEDDVLLLIPILKYTYISKPITFVQSISNGEFLFEKVLVGGALVIKNVSKYSHDSLNQLKARIAWAIPEFREGHKNLFKESRVDLRLPSIEDLDGNPLDEMTKLCKYVQQLYEYEIGSVIAYERVKPFYVCLDAKKWKEIAMAESCPEYFDKRLVPDISVHHVEISMKDWLGSNNIYMQIPKWIKQYQLDHGFVVNSGGLTPSVKPAIELISEPSIEFPNSPKMLSISYVAAQKDLFYKTNYIDIFNNSQSLLDSIPFVDLTIDASHINVINCDIIYEQILLTIAKNAIRPSRQFEAAITKALKEESPYHYLEEIFKEYGQIFCLKFAIGGRLIKLTEFTHFKQECLTKITNNGFEEITNCHKILDEWKNFLDQQQMDSTGFYLPNANSTVNINNINDIDLCLNTISENPNSWCIINLQQFLPLYKLLKDDLRNEIELLLSNEERVLMEVIGSIVSNNLKRPDLNLRFQVLSVSGFSVVIDDIDNKEIPKETTEDDLTIYWLLIGKPLSVKYFSNKTRNIQILTGTIGITLSHKQKLEIDIKEKMDKVGLLSLSPDCMIATSFKFHSTNFNPKFQVALHSWAKTKIYLEVTNHSFEKEAPESTHNLCSLYWYVIYTIQQESFVVNRKELCQTSWEYLGHHLKKETNVMPNVSEKYPNWLQKEKEKGNIVFHDYSLFNNVQDIGKGGFGHISSADYKDEKIALKNLKTKVATKEFVNELRQLQAMKFHRNINQFYGITIDPKNEYLMLVLQFANGGNLRQYIQRKWRNGDTFTISLNEIIKISRQVTLGLQLLHENNIIHCDLVSHSKNILINNGNFLIADFGLARKVDDTLVSSFSTLHGAAAFLDPLCHQPENKRNKKMDIFSLGVIFWELTSGAVPFGHALNVTAISVQMLQGYRHATIPETIVEVSITNCDRKPTPILTRNIAPNFFSVGLRMQVLNEPGLKALPLK
ncbi:7659_t:CDS:10 [Cetraspora pellucida]|uniref:7659_t:CDS:1 n=1 Tax=Cetraspora pellucida TaxID=1433469 RepID=A0A9N8Z2I5_9GLOM|nr:7659_t:CDS:10 [Cetraspora pellucida]